MSDARRTPRIVLGGDDVFAMDAFRSKPTLKGGSSDGTSGEMEAVWKKLEEHDRRFDVLERDVADIKKVTERTGGKVDQLVLWIAGTSIASLAFIGALIIGLWTYSSNRNSEALSVIQTALTAKPSEPQQPMVIVLPQQHVRPITPAK